MLCTQWTPNVLRPSDGAPSSGERPEYWGVRWVEMFSRGMRSLKVSTILLIVYFKDYNKGASHLAHSLGGGEGVFYVLSAFCPFPKVQLISCLDPFMYVRRAMRLWTLESHDKSHPMFFKGDSSNLSDLEEGSCTTLVRFSCHRMKCKP